MNTISNIVKIVKKYTENSSSHRILKKPPKIIYVAIYIRLKELSAD